MKKVIKSRQRIIAYILCASMILGLGFQSMAVFALKEQEPEDGSSSTHVVSVLDGTSIQASAEVSDGIFANNGEITMQISSLNEDENAAVKQTVQDVLGSTEHLGEIQIFQIKWFVDGEEAEPQSSIPVTLTGTDFQVGDQAADAKVFHITKTTGAYAENVNQEALEQYFAENSMDTALMADYDVSSITLTSEGKADTITVDVDDSEIYGIYSMADHAPPAETVEGEEEGIPTENETSAESLADTGNGIVITAEPDQDSYTAGDTITFQVTYTNQSKKDVLKKWNIVPSLTGDIGTITGGDLTRKLEDLKANGASYTIVYTVTLNEDITSEQSVFFTAAVKTGTGSDKDGWDWNTEVASGSLQFTVRTKSGVKIITADDNGSDVNSGILSPVFTVKNYNSEPETYSYQMNVKKNGNMLMEGTDYTVVWDDELSSPIEAQTEETGACQIKLVSIPVAGDSYDIDLMVTDKDGAESSKSITVTREATDISIMPDRAGPYLAGSDVTFTVKYTASSKLAANNWQIIPAIDNAELAEANETVLVNEIQTSELKSGNTKEFTYTIHIPMEMTTKDLIHFTASVQSRADKNKDWMDVSGGSDNYGFYIEPLTGIRVTQGYDAGSNVNVGQLDAEFVLKNYDAASMGYTDSLNVYKGDALLTEGTDYTLSWPKDFTNPMDGDTTSTGRAEVQLLTAPAVGETYKIVLDVTDDAGNQSEASVSYEKPYTSLVITADREGPYLAGSTVTFTAEYTADNKLEKNKWQIVPSIDHADIQAANSGVLTAEVQNGAINSGSTQSFTYTITIPEYIDTTAWINLTAKIQSQDGADSTNWSDVASACDSYAFKVTALKGVKVIAGEDSGSDIGSKNLRIQYTMRNYDNRVTGYTYEIEVKSEGAVVNPSDYTVEWTTELPDTDTTDDENLTMEKKSEARPVANIVFKEGTTYKAPYDVTLKITDESEASSSNTVHLTAASLSQIIPSGLLANGGLDLLYYGNVENDERVPFHNASQLRELLENSSLEHAKQVWERYRYDLYDPNCFLGDATCTKVGGKDRGYDYGGTDKADYPRFEDTLLAYPKDQSHSPFHATLDSRINPWKYKLEDGGIRFDNYFDELSKTAGPNDGEDNTNREYTVELSAETVPKGVTPRVYIIQIQTSWQMFDMLHANATEENPGIPTDPVGMAVGSCSNNTALANLYDVKQALIRFAEYLKEYDDGSTMMAVTNVQHTNTNSMIGGLGLSNDMSEVITGLINWDTFGDCEHVHYTSDALDHAISESSKIKEAWTDVNGTVIGEEAEKTVIIIGGPTENKNSLDGYEVPLNKTSVATGDNKRNEVLDHVYGIRVNEGTNVDGKMNGYGQPIISWLDIDANQELFTEQEGNGFYAAPSEDDVYNSLVDIFNKSNKDERKMDQSAVVKDVNISDTIQKEFSVNSVKAYYEDLTDGTQTELPTEDYEVNTTVNEDGSTKVDVNYKEVTGRKKLVVKINTAAKADYIGSNNVYTNVNQDADTESGIEAIGPQITGYTHTSTASGITKTYGAVDFKEKPQVNVPISFEVTDGLTVTKNPDQQVDLKDLAYEDDTLTEKITAEAEDLIDNYPQINGTLTYQWVDSEGNAVGEASSVKVKDGVSESPQIPSYVYTTTEEDVGAAKTFQLQVTFAPNEIEAGNQNDKPVLAKTETGEVHIDVAERGKNGSLSLNKQNTDGHALGGVEFALYKAQISDGEWSKADDTVYKTGSTSNDSGTQGNLTFKEIEPGNYLLYETESLDGYLKPSDPWHVVVDSDGSTTLTSSNGTAVDKTDDANSDYDSYKIMNYKNYQLPHTGGMGTCLFTISGAAIIMTALLLFISNKRKRRGDKQLL